jgi:hypothetical protein
LKEEDLKLNKNMTHEQIYQHMKKHGMQYSQYDGGLIDPKDPFGYEALSSAISQKTEKQLKEFLVNFVQYQEKNNKELVKAVTIEVEQTVQEKIEDSMSGIQKELELQREENKKLSEQLNSIQQEITVTQELNEKMDSIKQSMEQRKKESEEQQPKGLFSGWFGKKK